MAQSAKCPTLGFSSGHDLTVMRSSPKLDFKLCASLLKILSLSLLPSAHTHEHIPNKIFFKKLKKKKVLFLAKPKARQLKGTVNSELQQHYAFACRLMEHPKHSTENFRAIFKTRGMQGTATSSL